MTITLLGAYVAYALLRPIAYASQLLVVPPKTEQAVVGWPVNGQAALGIEGQGTVAASPEQHPVPIASITKLVTALAILEIKPLGLDEKGRTITFTANDEVIYQRVIDQDGAGLEVKADQTMTERHALEAMILPSANNIAITLVNWAFGSERHYVDYANAMLKKQGFTETHIAGASGLEVGSTSTPRELIKLVELTLKSPVLKAITEMPEVSISGFPHLKNINHVSGLVDSVHALKVGLTDEAGSCLAYWVDAAERGSAVAKIYGVILGQENFQDVVAYVNNVVNKDIPTNFSYATIARAGEPVVKYTDVTGEPVTATANGNITFPHWKGVDIKLEAADHRTLEIKTATVTQSIPLEAKTNTRLALTWRLLRPLQEAHSALSDVRSRVTQ